MSFFNNLSIKGKLFLISLVPIAGIVILIIVGATTTSKVSSELHELVEKHQARVVALEQVYAQGLQSGQAARNVLLNPADTKAKANFDQALKDYDIALKKVKELSKNESGFLSKANEMGEIWDEVAAYYQQAMNFAQAGDQISAVNILVTDATPKWREMKTVLFSLQEEADKELVTIKEAAISGADNASILMIIVGLIFAAIGLVFVFVGSGSIVNMLKKLLYATNKLIEGDTDVSLDINAKDEIGQLAASFNKMSEKISQQIEYLNSLPTPVMLIDPDFNIQYMNKTGAELLKSTQRDLIGKKCYDYFKTDQCRTKDCACAQAMAKGETITEETVSHAGKEDMHILYTGAPIKDKSGEIIGALEFVADVTESKEMQNYLARSTQTMLTEMEKFAQGDLTVYAKAEKKGDDIAQLFDGFNRAITNIREMIMKVTQAVEATASASSEISSSAEQMAAGAQEQSAQASEVAAAVEEMTSTIVETTRNASTAARTAQNAGDTAKDGGTVVSDTVTGMNRIAEVVSKAAETVKALGKSSDQIGEIVQVINDIADQTNLLALNAAIEAARAGEQGRGFAVVADEVRKLAERTTKATKEIAAMIKQIQTDTGGAVRSIEEGNEQVVHGKEMAMKAGTSMNDIMRASSEVLDIINQVATASEQQSATAEEISKNIEGINTVTQESSAGVQQIAHAAEDLNQLTHNLQQLVSQFKTDGNSGSRQLRGTNGQRLLK